MLNIITYAILDLFVFLKVLTDRTCQSHKVNFQRT